MLWLRWKTFSGSTASLTAVRRARESVLVLSSNAVTSEGTNSARADAGGPVAAELLVLLRRRDGEALHRQIESALRDGIRSGRFAAGTAMPSSRRLAAGLGVSRGVVVEAYSQLTAEGYLAGRSGSYTRVAADVPAEQAAFMARSQVLNFVDNFKAVITKPAWRSKPSWMLVAGKDRTINPDLERFMAKRMGAKTIEVKSSHLSMISHPAEITTLILEAAGVSTRRR